MRLDARNGDTGYRVYDAKRCCQVPDVVWCDDASAEWGRHVKPHLIINGSVVMETIREERITIHLDIRLVVFNEVADDAPQADVVGLVNRCTA